ncbi:MAG: translation elongation factor 4 [Acholeplasmataceae bacterium]|nr:translation elongation factor 4 [Acholeplasmataceae bacterium]MCK9427938.1 translation elongation factor 4 [Acholeplasmataceae bacterium]HHT39863.1 elongation factor 4 [Acholeplasmataceae bacterium]
MKVRKMKERQKYLRNFSIIAHIDHGKSTLADRILEMTNTISTREMKSQLLDGMELERERGITIKLTAVEVLYDADDGNQYTFHLIDTPGHVDFTYEVSRSLAACEGVLLVIDAAQGIEAQTLANVYLAMEHNLEIIPVINKIDLPNADPEKVLKEIENIIGISTDNAILASAKSGEGVKEILEAIVKYIPAPSGDEKKPLEALIFDSVFDLYRGAIPFIRIINGQVKKGDIIEMMSTKSHYEVVEVGVHKPQEEKRNYLKAGDVGYLTASIKVIKDVNVGDTITLKDNPTKTALPGYRKLNPVVFSGLYPIDNTKFNDLKDALEKLALNDSSLVYETESTTALGFGFRAGFLGLLHMEIVQERIEREFNIPLIATAPSVIYQVELTNEKTIFIDNPSKLPKPQEIAKILEPFIKTSILCPSEYVGAVMELAQRKRGQYLNIHYLEQTRVELTYELPLAEVIYDFFDALKSVTRGYASFDYVHSEYKESKLVKLDILLNGELVDALSTIVHRDFAYQRGRSLCLKLKDIIPRHLFEIPIQAAISNKIIARETIKALRKDVLAKCYGGDVSRKRKLLEKQKEGKKKMKAIGSVEIPQEAFMSILKSDDN